MSTREQFLPSKWITNPKHLPVFTCLSSGILLKTNTTTTVSSATSSFFTKGSYEGASASITVADTYTTICDLTGAGFMGSCVSPAHSAAFSPTIRITIDGMAYTFSSSGNISANFRMAIGAFTPGAVTSTATGGGDKTSSLQDAGFISPKDGGLPSLGGFPTISPPTLNLAEGIPMLRFESGLKVEMKASLLSADPEQVKGLVTYRMDI